MVTDAHAKAADAVVDDAVDSAVVDLPSSEKQKPSAEPELLTREQAEKLANEKHSKLDKRVAELEKMTSSHQKQAEAAERRAQAAEAALTETRRLAEENERKALGDSPDALSLFEAKVKQREKEAALARREAEIAAREAAQAEEIAEAKQYKLSKMADEIASEYGVEPDSLIQLTDGTREKMEKLAKVLPKKSSEDKPAMPKKPDSNKTTAAGGTKTLAQMENMSTEEYIKWRKSQQ